MTTDVWRPLGFEPSGSNSYDALHDGVPAWMAESFWDWMRSRLLRSQFTNPFDFEAYDVFLNQDLVRQVGRRCRIVLGNYGHDLASGMSAIRKDAESQNAELVMADYLLSIQTNEDPAEDLNTILEESGSLWKVGMRSGACGLVRRVPEGVQSAVDGTISSGGHAGKRLAEAWGAAYGVSPDPSRAYALAVKAVEDAAIPVVSPHDTSATLGKINSQLRNTGDWSLPLQREDEHAPTSTTLLSMMKMLWAGQADRHGGHHDPELVVTQEAAEVAVMTAATLVQWFASGAVARMRASKPTAS